MRALHQTILAGSVGSGHVNIVTSVLEEIMNLGALSKFSATVESYGLVRYVGRIGGKEVTKEVDGRSFIATNGNKARATEAIGDEHVTGFAIDAVKPFETFLLSAIFVIVVVVLARNQNPRRSSFLEFRK